MAPELLEELEEAVYFYDYTKVPYWNDEHYQRVKHLLDLTFSFSGDNDKLCEQALRAGERIAVVFAPADPARRATVGVRTSFREIMASPIVDPATQKMEIFGGHWLVVDGDASDYRIDDPKQCIVALNFKESTISSEIAPHLVEATRLARGTFARSVPDPRGMGARYQKARNRNTLWQAAFPANVTIDGEEVDRDDFEMMDLMDLARTYDEVKKISTDKKAIAAVRERAAQIKGGKLKVGRAAANPGYYENPEGDAEENLDLELESSVHHSDPSEPMTPRTSIPMGIVPGSDLLIGPHVPTILND